MDSELFAQVAQVEDVHWWFSARRAILQALLDSWLSDGPSASKEVLEVGCGNGGNLPLLSRYGRVTGVELDDEARARASERRIGKVVKGWLPDGLEVPRESFDLVALLDVLEHIEDDRASLVSLYQCVKPVGNILITVPAYPWLWSSWDVASFHKRRYTRMGLSRLMTEAGFDVLYSGYFNTFLFPIALTYLKVLAPMTSRPDAMMLKVPHSFINSFFRGVFGLERWLLPKVSFPFGQSIVVYAKKPLVSRNIRGKVVR